jgi:hypothetical protein
VKQSFLLEDHSSLPVLALFFWHRNKEITGPRENMEIDLKAIGYIKLGIGMNWLKSINWLVYVMERGVFCNEGTAFLNNI